MTSRWSRLLAGIAGTVLVAGCGTPATPDTPDAMPEKSVAATSPAPAAFDPPRTFGPLGAPLPPSVRRGKNGRLPVLLAGARAYVASVDQLLVVDLPSGASTGALTPRNEPAFDTDMIDWSGRYAPTPPVLVDDGGRARVVTAFAATVRGEGTTAPRPVVEVLTVDAAGGEEVARAELPADPDADREQPAVVGAHGSTVVLRIGADTTAVDITTGKVVWKRAGFTAQAVADGLVVGENEDLTVMRALDVAGGGQKWQSKPYRLVEVAPASPKVFTATGTDSAGREVFQLVEAASGRVLDSSVADSPIAYEVDCVWDQASVTVCQTGRPQQWVSAFDDTGKWLWELPADGRVAPRVTTAWHGAVYGTTDNGPVVLDARSGADRETRPGAAPVLVNESFGVGPLPETDVQQAHPALS
ncbi:PQQ-binding-like beta-propeller repeat protein [Actinoplanes utahensis]|uniref:PQQ-binding-like beta-propeller repeat protein n=1 Tax=Actinoplanes utahensis TaxID=1869 RepID=UPI0006918FF9|nr:PQQ-binding-like beta-propeller repeat protein [Actinoplanes utahensis]GIF32329.1 hypothetical protein Aut01nite_53150 [Actinoplanes utahensis]